MTMQPPVAVVDFLIEQSVARAKESEVGSPAATAAKVAIFDELDSLNSEEFAAVYAVYLVGTGGDQDFARALQSATKTGFKPIEGMTDDLGLHVALSRGLEAFLRDGRLGNVGGESIG